MVEKIKFKRELPVIEGVTVTVDGNQVVAKGPEGELREHIPRTTIVTVEGTTIKVEAKKTNKEAKKYSATLVSKIENIMKGVKEKHTYTLKICEGHFPMTVSVRGSNVEIKNFVGERRPRLIGIHPEAEVKVNAQDITVTSLKKEVAGQQAADIELTTRRKKFDRRKFQEGIYITEKSGKKIE